MLEEKRLPPSPLVDVHAHILPGLDHGPGSWNESMGMARIAEADGIAALAATPHLNYQFKPSPEKIRATTKDFRERLAAAGINLEIHVGGDYHLTPELLSETEQIITLGDNGRYFLLEFPSMVVPPNILNILKMFIDRGLTPVITHPERNPYLQRRLNLLEAMAKLGCPLQLTAGSLAGVFGEVVQEAARRFLERGLCHILASDAHWENERPPILSQYLPAAAEIIGHTAAREMMSTNPRKALDGEDIV